MRNRILLLAGLLAFSTAMASALSWEVGAIGAGGLSFAYGPYVDAWALTVSELGSSSLDAAGTSTSQLFPEWSAGVYGEIDFTDWIGVRLEPRWTYLGFSRLAATDAGVVFEQYGLRFSSILIPVLARGYLAFGPGSFTAALGPFMGIVVGPIDVVERYSDSTTTTALTTGGVCFGLCGGLGYAVDIGPGRAAAELRADWAVSPIAATPLGGDLYAVGATLAVSYGIPIGGESK
jgi:hypothetical protein